MSRMNPRAVTAVTLALALALPGLLQARPGLSPVERHSTKRCIASGAYHTPPALVYPPNTCVRSASSVCSVTRFHIVNPK